MLYTHAIQVQLIVYIVAGGGRQFIMYLLLSNKGSLAKEVVMIKTSEMIHYHGARLSKHHFVMAHSNHPPSLIQPSRFMIISYQNSSPHIS